MYSDFLILNWKDVVSAVISAVLSAVLTYIANLVDITNLDWKVMLGIAVITAASSLLKAFTTTGQGKFIGIVPVK